MSASPFFSAGGPHGSGVDLILARLDSQDRAVEAVRELAAQTLTEARQTNGRVRVLEQWVAHHDGVVEHAQEVEEEATETRDWWRDRATGFVAGLGSGVLLLIIAELLK